MSNYKHGMRRTRVWGIWSGMISRTTSPTDQAYGEYGGRGIGVDESWKDFRNFYSDMGDPPKGYSLERKNNDHGYCKENCVWADRKTQNRNKRNNHILTVDGVTRTMAEWSELSGIRLGTIWYRINAGWSPKDAVSLPLVTKRQGIPRGAMIHSFGAQNNVQFNQN